MEFPKIPTRIHFIGNEDACKEYVGLGKKRFADLTTAMGFQNLKTAFNTLELSNGVFIRTTMNHGVSTVEIYAPEILEEGGGVEEVLCFCSCHCAVAEVQLISKGLCCYDFYKQPTYDIKLCNLTKYRSIEDVYSLDFTPFVTGQLVVVVWLPDWNDTTSTYESNIDQICKEDDSLRLGITSMLPYGDAARKTI